MRRIAWNSRPGATGMVFGALFLGCVCGRGPEGLSREEQKEYERIMQRVP